MSIVTLELPEVKACETSRPKRCPTCGGETFQRWGGAVRKVRDPSIREVLVYRYRCCTCGHTFRHYPSGISQAQQTERMRVLAAIGWILGLSYRGTSGLFGAFQVELGRMSIWRDVQERAKQLEKERHWKAVRAGLGRNAKGFGGSGYGDRQPDHGGKSG
jgi:transposase